jgi:hypothetical protein
MLFVIVGEVEVAKGFLKGQTVGSGRMTLIHAERSRTIRAKEESLVAVALFDAKSDTIRTSAIAEIMRDAEPMVCDEAVDELLRHVRLFMDTGLVNVRFDEFLRMKLVTLLTDSLSPCSGPLGEAAIDTVLAMRRKLFCVAGDHPRPSVPGRTSACNCCDQECNIGNCLKNPSTNNHPNTTTA